MLRRYVARHPGLHAGRAPAARTLGALVAWFLLTLTSGPAPAAGVGEPSSQQEAAPRQRGIALGLFAEDPGFSYGRLLAEVAGTGARHVSLVVAHYQRDVRSVSISPHPRSSPPADVVERTLSQARAAGLKVMLFPIVRLEHAATPDEWRGTLRPRDLDAWWGSYRDFILAHARLASRHRVELLCIGSELSSLDGPPAAGEPDRWGELAAEVRRLYKGRLIYSANWDRYEQVGIWQHVDLAGISAYFQLTDGRTPADLRRLLHAWREQRVRISRWRAKVGKPLVITEIGYHSQTGTNAWPWDESADKPIDLAEQADCYRAFVRVWSGARYLEGVYFWNWFGWGGPRSREYTPRGKPAARVICDWYGAKQCPERWGLPGE